VPEGCEFVAVEFAPWEFIAADCVGWVSVFKVSSDWDVIVMDPEGCVFSAVEFEFCEFII
jgi:hypothetical protein